MAELQTLRHSVFTFVFVNPTFAGYKSSAGKGSLMMTKGAMGNLVNRYRAVLKKCHLLNVFGSLAIAGMLVMGAATGEAFGYDVGYNVTDSSSVGGTISADDSTSEAQARGVNA